MEPSLVCLQAILDVADPVVSPKRAALVRNEVSEDGWGQAQLPDHLQSVRSSHIDHVVRHKLLRANHLLGILCVISWNHSICIVTLAGTTCIVPSALYYLSSIVYSILPT